MAENGKRTAAPAQPRPAGSARGRAFVRQLNALRPGGGSVAVSLGPAQQPDAGAARTQQVLDGVDQQAADIQARQRADGGLERQGGQPEGVQGNQALPARAPRAAEGEHGSPEDGDEEGGGLAAKYGGDMPRPDPSKPAGADVVQALEAFAANHLNAVIVDVKGTVTTGFSDYELILQKFANQYDVRSKEAKETSEVGRVALEIALTLPFFFAGGASVAATVAAASFLVKAVDAGAAKRLEGALEHAAESEGGRDVLRKAVDKLNEQFSNKVTSNSGKWDLMKNYVLELEQALPEVRDFLTKQATDAKDIGTLAAIQAAMGELSRDKFERRMEEHLSKVERDPAVLGEGQQPNRRPIEKDELIQPPTGDHVEVKNLVVSVVVRGRRHVAQVRMSVYTDKEGGAETRRVYYFQGWVDAAKAGAVDMELEPGLMPIPSDQKNPDHRSMLPDDAPGRA